MGEKYSCGHKKGGEIYSEKLLHGFLCDPNLVYIFATRDTIYTVQAFAGVGKVLWETFLTWFLFAKLETLPPVEVSLSAFPVNTLGLGL